MKLRPLGKTGLMMSPIGLGCATFGREIDEETSWRVLDYAVEKGITFLDTAEAYGGGNSQQYRIKEYGVKDRREVTVEMNSSENIIGRWMEARGCRDEVTLCTKVSTGAGPENIRKALAASLERLRTDSVDAYKIHSPDPNVPVGESLDALNQEADAGRIVALGCSNFTADMLRESLEISRRRGYRCFEITQPPYNLALREYETDLFPLCRREQIAVTTYSPLGAGFFAGKYTAGMDELPSGTRFDIVPGHGDIYFHDRFFKIVEQLRAKSEETGIPMVRLAMAWAMSNPDVTAVLAGARKFDHIDNALESFRMNLGPELKAEMSSWGEI
ncbi:MAG: aldo/keto reductase [Acidobacteriota bacterium]|nr:aldo/keto reductase [Acidobacteriota bacterium]